MVLAQHRLASVTHEPEVVISSQVLLELGVVAGRKPTTGCPRSGSSQEVSGIARLRLRVQAADRLRFRGADPSGAGLGSG